MTILQRSGCPRCAESGKDMSKDNLISYTDGHQRCYACGFSYYPDNLKKVKIALNPIMQTSIVNQGIFLPEDTSSVLGQESLTWLKKYQLTLEELNLFLWSESQKQLIFPVYQDNILIFYQARHFLTKSLTKSLTKPPKYVTQGTLMHKICFLSREYLDKGYLVIVEDIVSAIKVSRQFATMPLFGSHLDKSKLLYLKQYTQHLLSPVYIIFWLDSDKILESMQFSRQASMLGLKTSIIHTIQDPKDFSQDEILNHIKHATNK